MPRGEGITYEQVAAAADGLVAQGQGPTARAVRAAIGGSTNTIVRHLQTWRSHRPQPVAAAARELPALLVRSYQEEVARVAAEARASIEAQLVEVQTEAADLARAADDFERERDALLEQLAALTRERDTLAGKEAVQLGELALLRSELERERRAAEEGRIAVAQERLAAEAQRAQRDAQQAELAALRTELQREHDARIEAQRVQAALGAAKEALVERLAEAHARERTALEEVEGLRARVEALVGVERTAAAELAVATKAVGELHESRLELERHRLSLHEAALENARLAGRLEALQRNHERGEPGS